MKHCVIPECESSQLARGWCSKHYQRWQSHGDPNSVEKLGRRPLPVLPRCSIPGCEREHEARGWCSLHYDRWRLKDSPTAEVRHYNSLDERFWSKVDRRGPEECWPWKYGKDASGYGMIRVDGRTLKAHRFVAGNPVGGVVRHTCDNPPCCNPAHLLIGTQQENVRDRDVRGRNGYRKRDHCPHGHPYSGANLVVDRNGRRSCRECRRAIWRAYYRRRWGSERQTWAIGLAGGAVRAAAGAALGALTVPPGEKTGGVS